MDATEIRPQPGPQERFISSPVDICVYGGSAGGGKSYGLVLQPLLHVGVKGFCGIIFRRLSTEIRGPGGIWNEALAIYPHVGGIPREQQLEVRFPSGAQVAFSHLQYEIDVQSHLSKQYAFIGMDQAELFEESQFWFMTGRLRSVCGVRPYMRLTANPKAGSWLAEFISWWIDEDGWPIPERDGVVRYFVRAPDDDRVVWADSPEELCDQFPSIKPHEPRSVTFIRARLEDNKILMRKDPDYEAKLKAMPLIDRMRFKDGNWKVRPAAGLMFRRSWYRFLDAAPADVKVRVRAWDKAGTEKKKTNDPAWTASVKMSLTRDKRIVVEDMRRMRGSPGQVENEIRATAELDGRGTEIAIWQDPGQAGKSDVDHYIRDVLQGWTVHGVPASEDKVTYAKPLSAQCETGNVYLVRGEWNADYIREHESFPDGKFKDQVDASSLAYKRLTSNKTVVIAKPDPDAGHTPRERL